MTGSELNPPRLSVWLLRHTCLGDRGESLTGDLIERFREGATSRWFWKQVLIASTMGALFEIRRRWAILCYAVAGTVVMYTPRIYAPIRISAWLHWSDFPWPLSQFVFELSTPVLVTLTTLTLLSAALMIQHSFRWAYVFRTWIINFALITIGHYSIDVFPWLLRPIPGNPYVKILIIPEDAQFLLLMSTFVIAAWVGCPMIGDDAKTRRPTVSP